MTPKWRREIRNGEGPGTLSIVLMALPIMLALVFFNLFIG